MPPTLSNLIEERGKMFNEKFTILSNAGTPLLRYTDAGLIASFNRQSALLIWNAAVREIEKWAHKKAVRCARCFGNKSIQHNHSPSTVSDLLDHLSSLITNSEDK